MKDLAQEIIDNFPNKAGNNRPMLGLDAAAHLMELVAETTGNYIEIGSAYGGSAIMAAMAMEYAERDGLVMCIDPFGCVNRLDPPDQIYEKFWNNITHYGLHERMIVFRQFHPPFPEPIFFQKFSVGLVDGNHVGDGPMWDANSLAVRVTKYLLFDNADMPHVSDVVDEADAHDEWEIYKDFEYDSEHPGKTNRFVSLRRKK